MWWRAAVSAASTDHPGPLQGSGRRGKAHIADYVLVYRNTKLAVMEAKAGTSRSPKASARPRIRREAGSALHLRHQRQGIYGIDMDTGAEGECRAIPARRNCGTSPSPTQNDWRDRFAAVPFEDKGGSWQGRYYQDIAIDRVLEAIAAAATASC